jgi:hypothetical protein
MTAEYTDTELAALPDGLIARAREAILSVRRYLDWYELQEEITRVRAALQAGHRQLEQYIEDIDAGKPMGRMPISMSEILRGGKYFWGLAAVRREANLLIGVYCNEVLGDDSPYKDDLAIKLFGKYASYENWLAAVAALEPPQPRKRKRNNRSAEHRSAGVPPAPAGAVPAPAAVPRTNERPTSTERVPAKETAAAGKMPAAGADETSALHASASPLSKMSDEEAANARAAMDAWQATLHAWQDNPDPNAPMPEVPPEIMELARLNKDTGPDGLRCWNNYQRYLLDREAQIARLKGSGGSPAARG